MAYDVTILVPVYNEEATLQKLLGQLGSIKLKRKAQILIVNDGSADKSQAIIDRWAKKTSKPNFAIEAIEHPKNRGKGAAIQTGLSKAKGTYFVIQDADLEYNPSDIPKLLDVAFESDAPVVYGSRFLGDIKNMPKANYAANRFYNLLLRVLYGVKITDMHTCYKMIRTDLFKELDIHSEGFGYAPEVISKLLKRDIPILEVPISYNGRNAQQGKKINAADGVECLWQLLRYRFSRSS